MTKDLIELHKIENNKLDIIQLSQSIQKGHSFGEDIFEDQE